MSNVRNGERKAAIGWPAIVETDTEPLLETHWSSRWP